MAAGVLTFSQYIGGADQLIIEQAFPSTQRSVVYNFAQDITDWEFSADYQTIVVDTIAFNRYTGAPNFANSSVIGSFPKVDITGAMEPTAINLATGTVQVNFPAEMYTGPIIPDARKNVPIVVFGFTWSIESTPRQIFTHRWAFIQCYEPDVALGDPTNAVGYTALVV
tara:strand:+ start:1900 stop:2403 length:504 start_codon:yes stop_codon:yes gene_type:complete